MIVHYNGKGVSRTRALALARVINKKKHHQAVVTLHGAAPPSPHRGHPVPDYEFRVGQRVRTRSHGIGLVESRSRNLDWPGAGDLYHVRVGSVLHLQNAEQIQPIGGVQRKITSRLARDPILLTPGQKRSLRSLVSGFGPLSYAERAAARNFHAMGLLKTNSIVDPSYVTLSSAGEKALAS
jgi:hypothetical protein